MLAILAVAAIMATLMRNASLLFMLVLIVLPTVCTVIFVTVRVCHLTALNSAITSVAGTVHFVSDGRFVIFHCLVIITSPFRHVELVGPIR